ncbi:outer membrane beta-barrel protein [Tabrizicola sp.]|uniref:outer membrane protein n=1 Tax=Tabrizicola sp. TaxID=2005166 RepID=UPI00262990F1|nr:outer membrane beta-barrel protein [Tabrizicola sp.]MDM7930881.1 outer membrane beta-barrel protein [Tabrizicola sp.]
MQRYIITAAMLAAFAAPSFAGGPVAVADDPAPAAAPAPAAVHDWSGPYVGLSYGRTSGDLNDSFTVYDYETGSAAGGFLGYNLQRGRVVYGAELAYSSVNDAILVGAGGDDSLDSLLDLRGRIGFAAGKALVYGAVGYSRGELTVNGTDSPSVSGTSLGLGVDFMLGQRAFVGIDYTSRNLSGTNDNPGNTFDIDTTVNSVGLRVGLSF